MKAIVEFFIFTVTSQQQNILLVSVENPVQSCKWQYATEKCPRKSQTGIAYLDVFINVGNHMNPSSFILIHGI